MPVPFGRRRRQPRERVSNRKAKDPNAVASKAAETHEGESSHDGPANARSTQRGASSGEYRPL